MSEKLPFDLNNVKDTALRVIQQPVEFYRTMPRTGGLTDPIIFLVVMGFVAGLIFTVFGLFGGGRLAGMGIAALIGFPIFMLIWSFVSAAILYVIWRLMGSAENYETAYRCVAFASAIMPVMAVASILPYIGTILGVLWGTYLMFTASIEVHKIDRQKATFVFAVLAAISILMNLSGEYGARHVNSQMGDFDSKMGQMMEGMEDMTPEEAGRAMGEFMRGMEEAASEK